MLKYKHSLVLVGLVGSKRQCINVALADGEIRHRSGQWHSVLVATITGIPMSSVNKKLKKSGRNEH